MRDATELKENAAHFADVLASCDIPPAGDPRFKSILDQMWAMHCRKGADYGTDADIFANVRASEQFGIPAWLGAVLRANDKMARLKTFATKGSLQNEGVEDSLMDMAAYSIIGLVLFRERKQSRLDDLADIEAIDAAQASGPATPYKAFREELGLQYGAIRERKQP